MNSKVLLLAVPNVLLFPSTVKAADRPNIIIIQTDEHNFRTLGCYRDIMTEDQAYMWGKGIKVETPNIDAIAKGGVLCSNYYASSPVSTPSRASFQTGLYPQATGAPKNGLNLDPKLPTFASILRDNGYSTSYVGKWHLEGNRVYDFDIKNSAGWTDHEFMMEGGHNKFYRITDGKFEALGSMQYEKLTLEERKNVFQSTEYFTEKALAILERDKNKPFCLMLSIPDPHTPDYAGEPYHSMYDKLKPVAPVTMSPELKAQRPGWAVGNIESDHNDVSTFNEKALIQYFGMVKCIDDNVGKILAFLDKNKLTDNTIVIFTSDHGDMLYEHNRVNKGVPYEASARIPFVMRYPAKIVPGKILKEAFTTVDFAPTILGIMGVKSKVSFHGINASTDFFAADKEVVSDRITYYAKEGGWWVAAVDARYKLVLSKNDKPYLFDLQKDPNELVNYYNDKDYSAIAQKLMKELFAQMNKFKEPGLLNIKKKFITE